MSSALNRLIIVASIQGVQQVVGSIGSIGNAAAAAGGQASLLSRALGGLFTAGAILGIAKYSDAFIDLQNKLKVVTTGTENLAQVTGELYKIAINSRTAFTDTAKLYQRVALAGQQLGNSQQTNLRVTDLLNKAIITSGSTTIEASNAMIQLSQGLAKGTLNGDELRSVLEQLPYVADLIAQHMGVTRGELRALGAEGKITAQIVQESILSAGDNIDATFAKLTPTIGQAFTNLESSITRLLGQINEATGFANALAQGVLYVADNLDTMAIAAATAGAAFAVFKTIQFASWMSEIINVTMALGTFRGMAMQVAVPMSRMALGMTIVRTAFLQAAQAAIAFSLSNPFTAIALALTALLPLMYKYGDQVKLTSDGTYSLRDALDEIGTAISAGVVPFMQTLGDILAGLGGAFQALGQVIGSILSVFTGYGDVIQAAFGGTVSFGTVVYALIEGLVYFGRIVAAAAILPLRGLAEIFYALGGISESAMENIRNSTDRILNVGQAALEAQGRISAFAQGTTAAGNSAAAASPSLANYSASTKGMADAAGAASGALKEKQSYLLEEDILYTKITAGQSQVTTVWNAGTNSLNAQTTSLKGRNDALKVSADGVNAITASEAYYAEQAKKSTSATETLKTSTSTLTKDAMKPANEALSSVGSSAVTTGTSMSKLSDTTALLAKGTTQAKDATKALSDMLVTSAANAAKAAQAYLAAADAAAKMRAAGATPSGGQVLQHNGAIPSQAAMRYHSGGLAGLRPDEYSAILQKGEEVLTKDDPRNRLNNGYQFNTMLDAAGFPTDNSNQAAFSNSGLDSRSFMNYARDPNQGPFDVTVWNGTSATYAQPLELMLEQMKKNGEKLPTNLTANAVRYDSRGYGETMGYAGYNPWDPFGRAIAEKQATLLAAQAWGDKPNAGTLRDISELMKFQDIWTKNFNGEWFTKDNLNQLLAGEMQKKSSVTDYQTYAPWQQGQNNQQQMYGWQPDLVATNGGGMPAGETKYEIKIEVNGAKDADSFRRNKDEIESTVMGMVRRADRRRNR